MITKRASNAAATIWQARKQARETERVNDMCAHTRLHTYDTQHAYTKPCRTVSRLSGLPFRERSVSDALDALLIEWTNRQIERRQASVSISKSKLCDWFMVKERQRWQMGSGLSICVALLKHLREVKLHWPVRRARSYARIVMTSRYSGFSLSSLSSFPRRSMT